MSEVIIIKLNIEYVTALKRKRGELNLNVLELSKQTDVSRWTLDKILSGKANNIHNDTKEKLDRWLCQNI